jgi:hypothetical protein
MVMTMHRDLPASVAQAVHDLAEAIMATDAYQNTVAAAGRVRANPPLEASRATPAGRRYHRRESHPANEGPPDAAQALAALCRDVDHTISEALGMEFAAHARRSGCCG